MAISNSVRVGVTYLAIDGAAQDLVGDLEVTYNTIKRETLSGMDGVHGVKEIPGPAKIGFTVRDSNLLSISDFQSMNNVNISVILGNGKQVVVTSCWLVGDVTLSAAEATIKLEFETASLDELRG